MIRIYKIRKAIYVMEALCFVGTGGISGNIAYDQHSITNSYNTNFPIS